MRQMLLESTNENPKHEEAQAGKDMLFFKVPLPKPKYLEMDHERLSHDITLQRSVARYCMALGKDISERNIKHCSLRSSRRVK